MELIKCVIWRNITSNRNARFFNVIHSILVIVLFGGALCYGQTAKSNKNTNDGEYASYSKKLVKRAEKGDAKAQYNLGSCYENGDGIDKNINEAVKWYMKAAEQGMPEAQSYLGLCYALGNGVSKDSDEAVKWWKNALEQGYEPAIDMLKTVNGLSVEP